MTILIDLDSTITNFAETLLEVLNKENCTKFTYDQVDSWEWFEQNFFKPWEPLKYAGFWEKIEPYPNAVKTMEDWVKSGHEVYIVTASFFLPSLAFKINHTLNYFDCSLISEHNIVIAHDKFVVNGDVLIDDKPENCITFPNYAILYSQPWNINYPWSIGRVKNWSEVRDMVTLLSH